MAVSYNDKFFLGNDTQFQNRVLQSVLAAAISIASEGFGVAFHKQRADRAAAILNNPTVYKTEWAETVANDLNCINDATGTGTTALTAANAAAQAALVTDAHIDAAVAGQWNAFLTLP